MINVSQNSAFEAVYESGVTGLLGSVAVQIDDNQGITVFGPTILNIIELGATGVYRANLTAPATVGQYTIIWSNDGSFNPDAGEGVEDLVVLTPSQSSAALPPIPSGDDENALTYGPCSSWCTTDDVDLCCSLPETSNPEEFIPQLEAEIAAASTFLWDKSGRRYSGLCQRTVRPCRTGCTCNFQVLSRGHIVAPVSWQGDSWYCEGTPCGCSSVSRVRLAGYPVREIVQVTIDGDIVDPSEYALREYRYLDRLNGGRWPACQDMSVGDDEDGSFTVIYTHGQDPPQNGRDAAAALACQMLLACLGSEDCTLPTGARRVTRQGITIDATFFGLDERNGIWRTGIPRVDAFLSAVNPHDLVRNATIWAPGARYARKA